MNKGMDWHPPSRQAKKWREEINATRQPRMSSNRIMSSENDGFSLFLVSPSVFDAYQTYSDSTNNMYRRCMWYMFRDCHITNVRKWHIVQRPRLRINTRL